MVIRPQMFALKPASYFQIYPEMRLFSTQRKYCFHVAHIPDIFFEKLERAG
jgi:hypothetical protein